MKSSTVLTTVTALANSARLEVFRLLVIAGPVGLSNQDLARQLGITGGAMTLHLRILRDAGLVEVREEGRILGDNSARQGRGQGGDNLRQAGAVKRPGVVLCRALPSRVDDLVRLLQSGVAPPA